MRDDYNINLVKRVVYISLQQKTEEYIKYNIWTQVVNINIKLLKQFKRKSNYGLLTANRNWKHTVGRKVKQKINISTRIKTYIFVGIIQIFQYGIYVHLYRKVIFNIAFLVA